MRGAQQLGSGVGGGAGGCDAAVLAAENAELRRALAQRDHELAQVSVWRVVGGSISSRSSVITSRSSVINRQCSLASRQR